ncbi:hypothetical protein GCM10022226_62540 [Sphaerisporangium flaviroseum]|uniref:Uncharacterized protein n=1 Tax=Sphaerisporangium flaviroseum TaxID=509199 RepID=A0ABP7J348_9ACTN
MGAKRRRRKTPVFDGWGPQIMRAVLIIVDWWLNARSRRSRLRDGCRIRPNAQVG